MGGVMTGAVLALAVSIVIRCALATEYVVGEGTCLQGAWSYALGCDYNTWALKHEFAVGDKLVFNFEVGVNNVAEVTKLEYDGCIISTPANPISIYKKSPASITLSNTATFYFVSTALGLPSFCTFQMLAVTVNATSSHSPSVDSPPNTPPLDDHHTTPTTTTTTTTTPAASSTTSSHESSSSSHSTMVKAVVGSVVGFVLFLAKILIIVYCVQRRRQRIRLNAQLGPPPINHTVDPVYNAN